MKVLKTCVAFLLVIGVVFAQRTGKIAGTTTAQDGTPLSGANVVVEGTSLGAASDEQGNYYILEVPPGVYTLRVDYIGYKSVVMSNIAVTTGITTVQDFVLEVAAVEGETVEIVAERPIANLTATNAVRNMDVEQIQNFATRDVTDMLAVQPGIVTLNGMLHVRGSRPDEVGYEVEGASTRNPITAGVIQTGQQAPGRDLSAGGNYNLVSVIPEALEEIQVQSGGYTADVGGGNAGLVQQSLRIGGSRLSGSVLYQTDALAPALSSDETMSYGRNDITATLGGPLTSKIRFFGAVSDVSTNDWSPQWWEEVTINEGKAMPDLISGLTPSGDSVIVKWDKKLPQGNIIASYYDHKDSTWKTVDAPADARSREQTTFNGTLLFDFSPLVMRVGALYSNSSRRSNSIPIYRMFNTERTRQSDANSLTLTLKGNFFLSPTTYVRFKANTINRTTESYDHSFADRKDNISDWLAWGDSLEIAKINKDWAANWKGRYNPPDNFSVNTFQFQRPGDITVGYGKSLRNKVAAGLDFVTQQGAHEVTAGGEMERWTYRSFYFGSGIIMAINQSIRDSVLFESDITGETEKAAKKIRNSRVRNIGYDEFGNEVDSGPDRAKHPTVASVYLHDKFEIKDLIVSVGLRVSQFNLDDWKLVDPEDPPYDLAGASADPAGLKESNARTIYQPRLALGFPLSDRSTFHLQFGRYAQLPDLAQPYKGRAQMALTWGGQNFIRDPMAFDLDPIVSTQYEAGYVYQLGDLAAIDITAFARNTTGQLVVTRYEVPANAEHGAADHEVYVNGDFSSSTGVEFTLRTRRINRFLASVNYTFADARGTNSFPNSAVGNLAHEAEPPLYAAPLRYGQSHRGSVSLDFRYGDEGGPLLSNLGVNLLFTFNSGHRYTLSTGGMGQRAADEGALLADSDPRNREPLESVNASTTPWIFNTDLRINKTFRLGGLNLEGYAIVKNLFNRKHVENVYNRTGDAYDDGFLSNPKLSEKIVEAQGDTYVEMYQAINLGHRQHWIFDHGFDIFGVPRTVNVGIEVAF